MRRAPRPHLAKPLRSERPGRDEATSLTRLLPRRVFGYQSSPGSRRRARPSNEATRRHTRPQNASCCNRGRRHSDSGGRRVAMVAAASDDTELTRPPPSVPAVAVQPPEQGSEALEASRPMWTQSNGPASARGVDVARPMNSSADGATDAASPLRRGRVQNRSRIAEADRRWPASSAASSSRPRSPRAREALRTSRGGVCVREST